MSTKKLLTLSLMLLFAYTASAQTATELHGRIYDAVSGEALPFASVRFDGTTIGTVTDMDGRFSLSTTEPYRHLVVHMMGYEDATFDIQPGTTQRRIKIKLKPQAHQLGTVEISANRGKRRRYRRRGNPAVELARKVMDHADSNRIESLPCYSRSVYEKLTMSLDDFHPDYEHHLPLRHYSFLQKYVGHTIFDNTPILPLSMQEQVLNQSYTRSPRRHRSLLTGRRLEGIGRMLGEEGLDANIDAIFSPIDIYDNDISVMLNHFVSPLSPTLGLLFYRYYITDTTLVDGQRCVELSFVPASSETYGFTGRMYVALDSSYALTRYEMSVSPHVVINFVQGINVVQTFSRDSSGHYLPQRCDTYLRVYVGRKMQKLYLHQVRHFSNYTIGDTATLLPDSLFDALSGQAEAPPAKRMLHGDSALTRPLPLTPEEAAFGEMRAELERHTGFRTFRTLGKIVLSGYVPTHRHRAESRFDIGPIYNTLSHNLTEGWRLRLGGMTTAKLNPRHFGEGYVAYGFNDQRLKYNATYTYTFDDKYHHSHEAPHNLFSLSSSYDIEAPGMAFDNFDRDNILMSNSSGRGVMYTWRASAMLRRQWRSGLGFDTRLEYRSQEPAGILEYLQYQPDGTLRRLDRIDMAEWATTFTFNPGRAVDNRRMGNGNNLRLALDYPTVNLTHRLVYLLDGSLINHTHLAVEKRFWLSSFGHIDLRLHSGIVWNKAPYPQLYFPNGNDGLFLSNTSFNTMRPMEFVADRYAALFAAYHLKGWILNHIPLVNLLGWREVVGFNILVGSLSDANNPSLPGNAGLYRLPDGTSPLTATPYMEFSIGIENILRFIRVDYVRRLSYTDLLPADKRGFIRLEFRFTL